MNSVTGEYDTLSSVAGSDIQVVNETPEDVLILQVSRVSRSGRGVERRQLARL